MYRMKWLKFLSAMSTSIVIPLIVSGCATQNQSVVADIGGEKVTLKEFEREYAKNNGGLDSAKNSTLEQREKFLDLYVKFKLKVREAYDLGYDKDSSVQSELNEYRNSLAVKYFLDKNVTDPAIKKMYERRKEYIRASHILFRVPSDAPPADTLRQYNLAMQVIDSLKQGVPFEQLALDNSQDPSVKVNKGDLGYFTSGSVVPEFEDAAYSLQPGQFTTTPVRTQFGYHIIKVTDRAPNTGTIRVSHIMKRLPEGASVEDSLKAMHDLEAVLDSLQHGGSFEHFAEKVSDDRYSGIHGGDLGFIERRRTVPSFEQAAFALKKGEISGIVRTPFGLHIIKVTDAKPMPSFSELEPELKKFYQQYVYNSDYNRLVARLKKEYGFVTSDSTVLTCMQEVDTTKTLNDPSWDSSFTAETRAKTLFSFAGRTISVDSALQLAKEDQDLHQMLLKDRSTLKTIFEKVGDNAVVGYHALQVESNDPEFVEVMKEYKDGSMLFKAEQAEVWNKIATNDSSLRVYYDAHKDKFTWPDRVNVQEIWVGTDSAATAISSLLKTGKLDFDSAATLYNERGSTKIKKGEWGLLPVGTNDLTRQGWNMAVDSMSDPFKFDNGYSIIKVLQRDPARDKTMDEAGSELSAAYQDYESKKLESAWSDELMKKYPVVIYNDALKNAFSQTVAQ
jgi:peptidyl-prolyl cis-trans isomerase SurA